MEVQDILNIVQEIGETRSIELKKSMSWQEKETQFKITKSIMAFSNIRDGGKIILGVNEDENGKFQPKGMTNNDFDSFRQDLLSDYVNTFVNPYANFKVNHVTNGTLNFVVIDVKEFDRSPVLCKKDYNVDRDKIIREGDIITRTTTRRFESARVRTHIDMQEIIDLAVEKGLRKFIQTAQTAGITLTQGKSEDELFEEELGNEI
ncbi:MAG: AlbA family DNA-binding domain-containing protein [Nitrososphaeraceae archaeon]